MFSFTQDNFDILALNNLDADWGDLNVLLNHFDSTLSEEDDFHSNSSNIVTIKPTMDCKECGKPFHPVSPLKSTYNPLLSISALSDQHNQFYNASETCNSCSLRDMFSRDVNPASDDWPKGTSNVCLSDILSLDYLQNSWLMQENDSNVMEAFTDMTKPDSIKKEIKKEKQSDYGSESSFSDFNDDVSDFFTSHHENSDFSDLFLSDEDFAQHSDDDLIDVESVDNLEILPGCSSHSAQVAEMHNYSTPFLQHHNSSSHEFSNHKVNREIDFRSSVSAPSSRVGRMMCNNRSRQEEDTRMMYNNRSRHEEEDTRPVEERCYVLSSTRVVKKAVSSGMSTMSHSQKSCRRMGTNKRRREVSEEPEYIPEMKHRKKEFNDEKREQHNVLERIRRCHLTKLLDEVRHHTPTLADGKKHSKYTILSETTAYIYSIADQVSRLNAQVDKLKKEELALQRRLNSLS